MFWKVLALCAVVLAVAWGHDAQQSREVRASQRATASAEQQANNNEVLQRGAVVLSERVFDTFSLRTVEMPKRAVYGTEVVTCFLFDAPHAATIACQEVGEPAF